jgi:Gamma tubulin complex component N-terminal
VDFKLAEDDGGILWCDFEFTKIKMLHEVLLALLGHSGDLFESDTFQVSLGFPDLYPGERETLNKLGILGKEYQDILNNVERPTNFDFETVFKNTLKLYLHNYRNDVLGLEKDILEFDHTSIYTIHNRLEKV